MEVWFTKRIGSGKFLNGTDVPDYLDIFVYVIVERLVMMEKTCFEGAKKLDIQNKCPVICKYVKSFHDYPAFTEHCITEEAFAKHSELQNANPIGVKYQLDLKSLPVPADG